MATSGSITSALVRDIWLTGFDALSLHTMYVNKLICEQERMQAIVRVNRRAVVLMLEKYEVCR